MVNHHELKRLVLTSLLFRMGTVTAVSAIHPMFLVEEEGTASTFQGLRDVVERHGLFCSLYTNRGSHYLYAEGWGEARVRSRQGAIKPTTFKHFWMNTD